MRLIRLGKDDRFEIFGHVFNGIRDVELAIEYHSRINKGSDGKRFHWASEPKKPIDGIHVAQLYEPYPRFDSDDCDTRDYCNYYFSTTPFTAQKVGQLSTIPGRFNACQVTALMPAWAAPAIYRDGDSSTIIVALPD